MSFPILWVIHFLQSQKAFHHECVDAFQFVRKMFTSEDEKVKVRLTGTEDSDWRDLEFIIYPLTETSESYSVDKCYKEIKEKAKEHNVFYYSLYLYRYEVPNSVGKIKVDDVETPFFKGLRFYNKKQ